jgi:hypothetical protein
VEEIDDEGRSSGSAFLGRRCRGEGELWEWCGVERRWCCPFIGRRGKGERRAEAWRSSAGAPLMAAAAARCGTRYGEGKG